MKVYYPTGRTHIVFVSPGKFHPEVKKWWDSEANKPTMFTIKFENGVADVDSDMGDYLVKHGFAQKNPVSLPPKRAAAVSEAEADRLRAVNASMAAQLQAAKVLLAEQAKQLANL